MRHNKSQDIGFKYNPKVENLSMETRDEELISLIARCAIKDQSALKDIFDRLGPYLNSVAFNIVKSEDQSNDVLQEAFIQIWQNADSYRPHLSKPLTWMTSIVRYRSLDRLDKEKRIRNHTLSDEESRLIDSIESEENPEEDACHHQLRSQIQHCMKGLSSKVKNSIELAYLYGYSRDEIAHQFQTNTNTVKSWLRRGAERLKQCLETKIRLNA